MAQIQPRDDTLQLRRAVVSRLSADTTVTALTPRIYGRHVPANPVWPFVRYGVPDTRPFEASGYGGSDSAVTVHAFVKGPDETATAALAAAIKESLSADTLPLADGITLVSLDWTRTQILEEGDDYHAVIEFSVVTG